MTTFAREMETGKAEWIYVGLGYIPDYSIFLIN